MTPPSHPALEIAGTPGWDLQVAAGELLAIIGPSGAGKTTLLRAVTGLDPLAQGRILLRGRDVTTVPVHRRGVTMMFEVPALFAQLDVAENIAMALSARRGPLEEDQLETALTALDLHHLSRRLPHQLSAGQRQRVALARALVSRPEVLLVDEPLAHVDPAARVGLRREILRTHRRMCTAALYVTHDWAEALAVADRLAVLREGRIVQIGAPREVYRRPRDAWVAQRIGVPNLLPCPVLAARAGQVRVRALGRELWVPADPELAATGEEALVLAHAHAIRIRPQSGDGPAPPDELDPACGRILGGSFGGDHVDYDVETAAGTLVSRRVLGPAEDPLAPGTPVEVCLDPEAVWAVRA
ncbi:ABC transporter ATP-binding protein [Brachybacterium hainanense]|uniref:ABC transporter ATP-binding protein n=1 Tax=Brachybacterium hainanense TaxID=1541174 RepID=A0ABV6R683_9MICO